MISHPPLAGGDQAGRRRKDVTTVVSRDPGGSTFDQARGAFHVLRRAPHRPRHPGVDLAVVARQLRWRARHGTQPVPRWELVLAGVAERALRQESGRARDTLTALIGNPQMHEMAEVVEGWVEEAGSAPAPVGASPGSASHDPADLAARRTKWVASKPRVAKTMRLGGQAAGDDSAYLYHLLPLAMDDAAAALSPGRAHPRGDAARRRAWRDKVHEVYSGHVNGRVELPRGKEHNFGWAVSLRELVPAEGDDGPARPRRARPTEDFEDLLKNVVAGRGRSRAGARGSDGDSDSGSGRGRGDGGGSGDGSRGGAAEPPEVRRMQVVLGGLRALRDIARGVDEDAARMPVMHAAVRAVVQLAEGAITAASGGPGARRAESVTTSQNSVFLSALQQAASSAAGARPEDVRRRAEAARRTGGARPSAAAAWAIFDGAR